MTKFEMLKDGGVGVQGLAPLQGIAADVDESEVDPRLVQCEEVALDNARGLANA